MSAAAPFAPSFRGLKTTALRRVGVDVCNQIMSDMEPYVDCALQRSESRQRRNGNQRSVRADALPARSEASWPIVAHPALLAIAEAVLVSRTIIATTWPAFSNDLKQRDARTYRGGRCAT